MLHLYKTFHNLKHSAEVENHMYILFSLLLVAVLILDLWLVTF